MKKKDIYEKLKEINIETSKFIIVGDASLVCHGIISKCYDIKIHSLVPINNKEIEVEVVKKLNKSDQINNFFFCHDFSYLVIICF